MKKLELSFRGDPVLLLTGATVRSARKVLSLLRECDRGRIGSTFIAALLLCLIGLVWRTPPVPALTDEARLVNQAITRVGDPALVRSTVATQTSGALPRSASPMQGHPIRAAPAALPAMQSMLSGRVLDATGGVIAGARLVASTAIPGQEWAVTSDELGTFQLPAPAGTIQLEVSADAYATTRLSAEAPTRELVLVLRPASSLRGVVLSAESKQPLSGILVQITGRDHMPPLQLSARSDAQGEFALNDVSSGEYELLALDAAWRSEPTVVLLGVSETRDRLEIEARRAARLSGSVNVEGRPCVEGYASLSSRTLSSVTTIAEGELSFDSVWPGHYELVLGCANAPLWGQTLELSLEPLRRTWDVPGGLRLEGSVQNADGTPRAGALVDVTAVGEPFERSGSRCTSDERGAFSCTGLVPGQYECHLGDSEFESESLHIAVPAAPGSVVLLSVPLARLEVSLPGVPNGEFARLSVSAQRTGAVARFARRDGDQFVFEALPIGVYDVRLDGSTVHSAARLEEAGAVVRVRLAPAQSSEISGTVMDAAGQAIPDVWVEARPAGSPPAVFQPPVGTPSLSDSEGRFTIVGLFDGLYNLSAASPAGEGWVAEVAGGRHDVRLALEPRVRAALPVPTGERRAE